MKIDDCLFIVAFVNIGEMDSRCRLFQKYMLAGISNRRFNYIMSTTSEQLIRVRNLDLIDPMI